MKSNVTDVPNGKFPFLPINQGNNTIKNDSVVIKIERVNQSNNILVPNNNQSAGYSLEIDEFSPELESLLNENESEENTDTLPSDIHIGREIRLAVQEVIDEKERELNRKFSIKKN